MELAAGRAMHESFFEKEEERKRFYADNASKLEEERRKKEQAGDITDANDRWGNAVKDSFDRRSPEITMAAAVMVERDKFKEQQDKLRERELAAKTPEERKLLELRRHIEACDYMAMGHDRNAVVSGILTGRRDNEFSNMDRERAEEWRRIGYELRRERAVLQQDVRNGAVQNFSDQVKDLERQARGNDLRKAPGLSVRETVQKSHEERGGEITDAKAAKLDAIREQYDRVQNQRSVEKQNAQQEARREGYSY